jgi:hypothetical protein
LVPQALKEHAELQESKAAVSPVLAALLAKPVPQALKA